MVRLAILIIALSVGFGLQLSNPVSFQSATTPNLSVGAIWVDSANSKAYVSTDGISWTRFGNLFN